MQTRKITITAMFVALIAVGAFLSVPVGAVHITLQTLFVMTAGLLLPKRQAVMAVAVYLLIGLIGLPVFAGGIGGLAILGKPSVGFLVGFLPLAWFSGMQFGQGKFSRFTGLLVGNVVLYLIGFTYMYWYFNMFVNKPMDVVKLLQIGVIPYLPGDIFKVVLAYLLAAVLRKYLKLEKDGKGLN